jgi:hypothetical protein
VEDVYKKFLYMHHLNNVAMPSLKSFEVQMTYDPNDNLYHGQTPALIRPGSYKVEVFASHDSTETNRFFRRSLQQFHLLFIRPNLDWQFSSIDFIKIQEEVEFDLFQVKFTPQDEFSNFVKPGKTDHIKFRPSNATLTGDPIEDDLEGNYFTTIRVPKNVLQPTVEVQFDNFVFDRRNITNDPIGDNWRFRPKVFTLRIGPSIPIGSSSDVFGPRMHVSVDFSSQINRNWAWLFNGGFSKFSGEGSTKDLTYWNISANSRWLPVVNSDYRIYVNAGGGLYIPDEGSSNAGFNIGAGMQIPLSTMIDFEVGGNYNNVIRAGNDFRFANFFGGLAIRF